MDGVFVIIGLLALAAAILPWVNLVMILRVKREVRQLMQARRSDILRQMPTAGDRDAQHDDKMAGPHSSSPQEKPLETLGDPAVATEAAMVTADHAITLNQHQHTPPTQAERPDSQQDSPSDASQGFRFSQLVEWQFGARLPVWIGGMALVMAGFFLVKYSIAQGWLSPLVRVMLGGLFGMSLLWAAEHLRARVARANEIRIAQALSGAGIAVLYFSCYAATILYALLPNTVGFSGMAVITATALVLSLRHGPAIALMGMAVGFLTPGLIGSSNPSAPLLFLYLGMLFSGVMMVIRCHDWWWLSIPSVLAALLWVVLWMLRGLDAGDTLWLALFLLGVSAVIVQQSRDQWTADTQMAQRWMHLPSLLNYIGLGSALLLMGAVASHGGIALMEWVWFGMLAGAGLLLAWFNPRIYGFVPWLAIAVTYVMLAGWRSGDMAEWMLVWGIYVALFAGVGYALLWNTPDKLHWGGLSAVAALGGYLLGYYRLHDAPFLADVPLFWGLLASALAAWSVYAVHEVRHRLQAGREQSLLIAGFATLATSLIALAMFIELEREFLSLAIAAQLFTLSWLSHRTSLAILRVLAGVMLAVFAAVLLPQIFLLLQLTAYSLIELRLPLQDTVPMVQWPVIQLGVPALLFVLSSWQLRAFQDGRLVHMLECTAITLAALMGYYLMRHAFHVDAQLLFAKAGFVERGATTNVLFVFGLSCLWIGRHYTRQAVTLAGMTLCMVALFRIGYFDMLRYNPAFAAQQVSGTGLFNALLLPFGLPLIWNHWHQRLADHHGWLQKISSAMQFMMLLALLTLNVRYAFHGEMMHHGEASLAEIYTYSIVWLIFGLGLAVAGICYERQSWRLASLGLLVVVVGKVFLYDASELDGLWRVMSFFGLGLSLIGLSYGYTRFVSRGAAM